MRQNRRSGRVGRPGLEPGTRGLKVLTPAVRLVDSSSLQVADLQECACGRPSNAALWWRLLWRCLANVSRADSRLASLQRAEGERPTTVIATAPVDGGLGARYAW